MSIYNSKEPHKRGKRKPILTQKWKNKLQDLGWQLNYGLEVVNGTGAFYLL